MLSRRHFIAASALSLVARRSLFASPAGPLPVVTVYKDPGCQCCAKWVKHLSSNGFVATVRDVTNVDEIKNTMGVPIPLRSCHTAVADKYVFEGHVPADVIKKLLTERPASTLGLAVPGMPTGSPGMEGGTPDRYDVVAFNRDGTTRVYAKR